MALMAEIPLQPPSFDTADGHEAEGPRTKDYLEFNRAAQWPLFSDPHGNSRILSPNVSRLPEAIIPAEIIQGLWVGRILVSPNAMIT